jgi:hypothetical protein
MNPPQVKPGQVWRHVPSDDVRIVADIVPYKVATSGLYEPREGEGDSSHIARMIHEGGGRDCRDSSDMDLSPAGDGFVPRWPATWELVVPRRGEVKP